MTPPSFPEYPPRWAGYPQRAEIRGWWPQPVRTTPVRIGDAERDQAVAALSEHFAAGRLTRDELDERVDQAMAARFDRELEPLFADLPETPQARPASDRPSRPTPPLLAVLMPQLLVAVVTLAVLLHAPWVIWGFVWLFLLSGMGRRRFGSRQHPRR